MSSLRLFIKQSLSNIMPTQEEIHSFSKKIEEYSILNKIGIMDSIVSYCEKNDMEIEVASSLISQKLKSRLYEEAQSLNLLPKVKKLPI